jgi:uncharacterized protein YwqG
LQLECEKDAGMTWCDSGVIYFLIHKDDLRDRKFENVWSVMQSA